jgi:HlyD family secretion protein
MRRRTKWVIGGGVAAFVIVGVAGALAWSKRPEGLEVWAATVERKELRSIVTANGTLEAKTKVDLSANIPGQIVTLQVEEGQPVRRGELLMVIDPAQFRASVDARRAGLSALESEVERLQESAALARREWERTDRQYEEGIVAAAEQDRARSLWEQEASALTRAERELGRARAELAAASDELAKTEIRAPMDGVVTRRNVERGEVVVTGTMNNPGTVLMTISDMATIEAVLEVDQTDVPLLRLGQRASVLVDAFPDRPFPGVVTEIGSSPIQRTSAISGQPTGTDYEVKITLDTAPDGVRPGLTVTADVVTETRAGALAIPIGALVVRQARDARAPAEDDRPDDDADSAPAPTTDVATVASREREEEGVYVIEGGTAVFRPVETGIRGEMDLEVVAGLDEGQQIVVGPFRALRELKDGQAVRIDREHGAAAAEDA